MGQDPGHPDLRVILVGRTGLNASLRLDPSIELVPVRTALAAVGELADPIDAQTPSRSVVIVGADAEPAPNGSTAARDEFLGALRLIDPNVRVIRALDRAPDADGAPLRGYDGIVRSDQPAEAVRAAVRAPVAAVRPSPAPPAPTPAPTPSLPARAAVPPAPPTPATTPLSIAAASAPAPLKPPQSPAPAEPTFPAALGDTPMARTLLRGGDLITQAVALIRARTSDGNVQFIHTGQPVPDIVTPVPVGAEGVAYGTLWSDRTIPEELRPHAEWMALWLRLGEQQAQLREAAFTDCLTGAWNRRYFDRYLSAAIDRARASHQPITVMVFDIDDFKRFNDRFGHGAADEILIETVRLLRSVIRPSDRVCRIGGDEFAVIFHEPSGPRKAGSTPPASVFEIASRFQDQIRASRFPKLGVGAPGTLTVSGGLASFPWDGATPADLLRHADLLAMQSKRAGKNAIVFGPGEPRV